MPKTAQRPSDLTQTIAFLTEMADKSWENTNLRSLFHDHMMDYSEDVPKDATGLQLAVTGDDLWVRWFHENKLYVDIIREFASDSPHFAQYVIAGMMR